MFDDNRLNCLLMAYTSLLFQPFPTTFHPSYRPSPSRSTAQGDLSDPLYKPAQIERD